MKNYINQLIALFIAALVLQACNTTHVSDATKQVAIAQAKVVYLKDAESTPGHNPDPTEKFTYEFVDEDYIVPEDSDSGLPEVHFNVHIHSNKRMTFGNVIIMAQNKNGKWTCIGGVGYN